MQNAAKLNTEVFQNIHISSQENMIIKSLEKFYDDENNINLFLPIVNSESEISIRLIDYFITKYSKIHKISYKLTENNIETYFNVFSSYKQQLKAFQKKHFDPFSRGDRIPYFMSDTCIITTIGQLNFFKWFISKKILDYVYLNKNDIEKEMNQKNRLEKTLIALKNQKPKIDNVKKKILYHQSSNVIKSNVPIKSTNVINRIVITFS